ncbi:hypothetical protein [Nocardia seriolae]|uniref:Uncharacterized protein n=1 Tax=Nocardia seriolae TaxID=37332 RepID=A0ABC8B483_9NOCA|nr:hypothetical protein [Nocardia seriolae]APB00768.1 hypothetical protein NS506_06737 [Nocardia seriolae]MTJ65327.1 hypothetical protein [Nocardia seriolae]MTJ71906.1 hypothetical protein [Nocardia seriolae]MTJ90213.1 hypothetical protein [Nocardia seriolae]MTK34176.1 hypothetical protein [Nocardia seriolae]
MSTTDEGLEVETLLSEEDFDDEPRLIATHYCGPDEALEMVKAAQLLGLGVRLSNRIRPDEEDAESATEEWLLDIFETPPVVDPED